MKKIRIVLVSILLLLSVFVAVNFQNVQASSSNKMLSGNKMRSTKVEIFFDANLPAGFKSDAQSAVLAWRKAVPKIQFDFTKDRNSANIVFTSGHFNEPINAMTFYDQTIPWREGMLIKTAIIKSNLDLIDENQRSNFGIQVAEHEIGHCLGLADVYDPALKFRTVMWSHDPNVSITGLDIKNVDSLYK